MGGHLHKTVLIKKMQEGLGTKNLTSVNLPILNIRNDISLGMTKKKCILKNKGAQDIQFTRYPAYFHIQYLARY